VGVESNTFHVPQAERLVLNNNSIMMERRSLLSIVRF
jgi:hypothetical protein